MSKAYLFAFKIDIMNTEHDVKKGECIMMPKYVYLFREGNKDMRNLLGGKGANLAEMTNIGLPVPRGFTVTTEACTDYYDNHEQIREEIKNNLNEILIDEYQDTNDVQEEFISYISNNNLYIVGHIKQSI